MTNYIHMILSGHLAFLFEGVGQLVEILAARLGVLELADEVGVLPTNSARRTWW
jgi:hypothetical protein